MEIAATGTTIWLHESSLISFMGNTRLRYSGLTVSFWVEYVMLCSSMYKPPPMIPLRHKLHTKVFPIILPPPISWWLVKLSISYWFPEEHPYIGDFSRFTAYVRTNFSRTHVHSDLLETHSIQPFPLGEPTTLCRPQGWKCHSGLLHFRRSAFSSPQTAGCAFCESFLCGESTSPTGDVSRDSKGAQHPWHTTLVQSLVCYTFPEVYTFLKCKKPHTQHLNGADMGLDASSA